MGLMWPEAGNAGCCGGSNGSIDSVFYPGPPRALSPTVGERQGRVSQGDLVVRLDTGPQTSKAHDGDAAHGRDKGMGVSNSFVAWNQGNNT